MKKVLQNKFDEEIKEGLWIVDFYANWCGPCMVMEDAMDKVSKSFNVLKVNVDEHQDLAMQYGIDAIPCLIKFKDGKMLNRSIGYLEYDEILKFIDSK